MSSLILGSHMSIEGGFYRAVERAAEAGCNCLQLFTAPPRQFAAHIIDEEAVTPGESQSNRALQNLVQPGNQFQEALQRCHISHPLSHASYLINLGSPDANLRQKGIQATLSELDRAAMLGIPNVVLHPGAYTSSTIETGLTLVCDSLDYIFERSAHTPTRILLENTAGQGTTLGSKIDELGFILKRVPQVERLGVCIDTCHAFAAGYDLSCAAGLENLLSEIQRHIGLEQIIALHLNDSKKECGSRVDRHEHIGHGRIGLDGFRLILNDTRLNSIPMYLETEKGTHDGEDWDVINLRTLRSLV